MRKYEYQGTDGLQVSYYPPLRYTYLDMCDIDSYEGLDPGTKYVDPECEPFGFFECESFDASEEFFDCEEIPNFEILAVFGRDKTSSLD